jgi:hypothetical protein
VPGPAWPCSLHGPSGPRPRPGQEPPEVTCPDPELDDGAEEDCRPLGLDLLELELELEPEPLAELAEWLFWLVEAAEDADWVCAAAGSPRAMPPPARTLAAPMATVTARSRPWPRSRAATAARTGLRSVPTGLSSFGAALLSALHTSIPGRLLGFLCPGWGTALSCAAAAAVPKLWTTVWIGRWKAAAHRG